MRMPGAAGLTERSSVKFQRERREYIDRSILRIADTFFPDGSLRNRSASLFLALRRAVDWQSASSEADPRTAAVARLLNLTDGDIPSTERIRKLLSPTRLSRRSASPGRAIVT